MSTRRGSGRRVAIALLLLPVLITGLAGDVTLAPDANTCQNSGSVHISAEKRLLKCLMADYDPAVRPVRYPSDTVQVTIDMAVITVVDLNEKERVLTTNGWLKQTWTDVQLAWTPKDYNDTKTIRIPADRLWKPDLVAHNNAAETYGYVMDKLVVVRFDGFVVWIPHARLRTYCTLDLTHFPFDTQHCHLVFGSWTYNDRAVNVSITAKPSKLHIQNSQEWEIIEYTNTRHLWNYTAREQYPGIVYSLSLKRISTFYRYMFIMPTVILAFLTLLLHFIPAQSGERMTLGMGLLISLTLLLLLLEQYLPTELGTVPVVAAYIAYLYVMLTISLTMSVIVLSFYHRDPKRGQVPEWIRWMFLGRLTRVLCIKTGEYSSVPADVAAEEVQAERELHGVYDSKANHGADELDLGGGAAGGGGHNASMEKTLEDIRRYLRLCAAKASMPQAQYSHQQLVRSEWHQVALVIDRLMFVLFVFVTILVTISMYGPTRWQ